MKKLWAILGNRRVRRAGVVLGVALVLAGAFVLTLRTAWFADAVRARLVAELETATGGTATIERFRFGKDWRAFVVEGIELRGAEPALDPALLSIRRVELRIRIDSFIGRRVSLERLRVVEPRVSLVVLDDGSTNLPSPKPVGGVDGAGSPARQLLDLAVKHFELEAGVLTWNNHPYKASLRGSDMVVTTAYRAAGPEYEINAVVGEVNWNLPSLPNMPTSVAIEAVLSHSGIDLPRLEITNDAVAIEATGTLSDLQRPRFSANYQINSRLRRLARALGVTGLPFDGGLRVDGELEWRSAANDLAYSGTITASGVSVDGLNAEKTLTARSSYRGDSDAVTLPDVVISALDGELSGSARISGPAATPRFALSGAATGFSVERLLALTGAAYLPWSGLIRAEFDAEGTSRSDLAANLNFEIESATKAGLFPLTGRGELHYNGGSARLEIPTVRIRSANTSLDVSGALTDSSRAALNVRVGMTALAELDPIFRSLGLGVAGLGVALASLDQDGEVILDGRLTGTLPFARTIAFDGELLAKKFSIGKQSWRTASVDARVTPTGADIRSARISDGIGTISVKGRLPFDTRGKLQATVAANGLDARKLAAALGFEFPVEGTLAANLTARGTLLDPQLAGNLTLTNLEIVGEPFDRLTAAADYSADGFVVRDALLIRGDASLKANATFAPGSKEFNFEIDSTSWPFEEFAFMRGNTSTLSGVVRFDLSGEGRQGLGKELFRSLNISGGWEVADLRQGNQELGSWTGDIETTNNEIHVKWLAAMLDGEASGESVLTPVGNSGYSGNFSFKNLGTQAVADLLELPLSNLEGQIDGQAEYAGELGAPEKFEMSGTIDRFEAGLSGIGSAAAGYRVSNLFPMRWSYTDDLVRLDSMNLNGSGTDIEIDGTIALADERAIDVAVEGRFNLILLEGFDPDIDASGTSNLNIQIGGTVDDIEAEGSMSIVDGSLRSATFPNGLSDINGRVDFAGRQMKIDDLTATSGGGTLRLSGVTIFGEDGPEYRIRAAAKRVRLRYPTNISSVFDGQLTLAGTGNRTILNGEVVVTRLSTAKDLTFGNLFASFRRPTRTQAAGSALQNVQLNIQVVSVPNLSVETRLVRNVEAEISLKVVGTGASPSLLGDIGITQGTITMFGTRYHVNRGDIRFVNPFRIEPVLNVELETRIRDVDLAIVLSGPVRRLNLNYRSDPPLPFNDLVNLLAVGRAPTVDPVLASRQRVEQQSLIQSGANNVLASTLARPVSQRLQRFFGVSRLKVDPQIGGPEANPSARISTEQQITNDLTLTYSYDLSSAQQQMVRIEWAPNRRWSFIVTRDENGLVGSDFLYKTRLP